MWIPRTGCDRSVSPDDAAAIRLRAFSGVRPNHRGIRDTVWTVGFDIETYKGIPYILSVSCEQAGLSIVEEIAPGEGLLRVLALIASVDNRRAGRHVTRRPTIAGAHNLRFDAGTLTFDYLKHREGKSWRDVPNPEQLDVSTPFGLWSLRIGKVAFATLKTAHRTIHVIDTFAYFHTSLDRMAEALGMAIRKLDKPRYLGLRKYALSRISPYARQDALIVDRGLRQITEWWRDYKIRPAISAPQMAARVFCHRFVKKPWVSVPDTVSIMSLCAYHGGKNGWYGRSGWYRVRSYDLRSAYVWAMTHMPPMTRGVWEWRTEAPEPGSWGFALVTGRMPEALRYPVFYSHDFEPLAPGQAFDSLAVSSVEYALLGELYPEWRPAAVASVTWLPDEGGETDLRAYALDMYERRQTATTPVENTLYKLLGNSLYGKFIARSPAEACARCGQEAEQHDPRVGRRSSNGSGPATPVVACKEFKAGAIGGSLFYPPIAAWITALVRCRITRLEYEYQALHTSTDGFLTERDASAACGPDLGQLKLVHEGPALICRNKLYLHFDDDGRLVTNALHGFQGTPAQLLRLVSSYGAPTYLVKRLAGWRESFRRDGLPFEPIERAMRLRLPDLERLRQNVNPFRLNLKGVQ